MRFTMRARYLAVLGFVAAVSGCATTPAADDPTQVKLNDLEARVTRIERVISNQSLVDLAQHLDQVQADVRQLRGRLEELEYKEEQLRKQQQRTVSAPPPPPTPIVPVPDTTAGAVAGSSGSSSDTGGAGSSEEQSVYAQSFDALKAGSYSVAITGFKDFLKSYPQSPLAENAQYWLGEAYYVTHDLDDAAASFRNVTQKWPNSRKTPDALLKLGYTQIDQKKVSEGKATLSDVAQKYPGTDAARLANERLQRLPK
jgi:tol-pal system protein YbgF